MVSVSLCTTGTYSIKSSLSLIEQITSLVTVGHSLTPSSDFEIFDAALTWLALCEQEVLGRVVCKDKELAVENNPKKCIWGVDSRSTRTKAGITARKKLNETAFCPFRIWTISGTGENMFFCDPATFREEDMYTPFKIHRADLEKKILLCYLENSVKFW